MPRIWYDTGHLNADSGAVGGGKVEVKRNDLLADEVERLSKIQGWVVGSTNESDHTQTLSARVADATKFGAELFVSIHHDWTKGGQAVIYQNTNDSKEVKGRRLAGCINRRIDNPNDGIPTHGIYADRRGLGILRGKMPAVVIEASRVQDPYVVGQMAMWIVQGICDYLGVAYKTVPSVPTTPKPKPTPPTLKFGSRGSWVNTLQGALNSKGAKLKRDGIFGSLTFNAVKNFQRNRGLVVDGIVGPKTWAKLGY